MNKIPHKMISDVYSKKEVDDLINSGGSSIDAMAIGNINNPLLDMPLNNSLNMKQGCLGGNFTRNSQKYYTNMMGNIQLAEIDEPCFEKNGLSFEPDGKNYLLGTKNWSHWTSSTSIETEFENIISPLGTNDDVIKVTCIDDYDDTYMDESGSRYIYINDDDDSIVTAGMVTFSVWMRSTTPTTINICIENPEYSLYEENRIKSVDIDAEWKRYSVTSYCYKTVYVLIEEDQEIYMWWPQLEYTIQQTSNIVNDETYNTRSIDTLQIYSKNNMPNVYDPITVIMDVNLTKQQLDGDKYHGIFQSGDLHIKGGTLDDLLHETTDNVGKDIVKLWVYKNYSEIWKTVYYSGNFRLAVTYDPKLDLLRVFFNGDFLYDTPNDSSTITRYEYISIMANTFGWIKNVRIWNSILTDNEIRLA